MKYLFGAGNGRQNLSGRFAVDIQNIVGDIIPALIQHFDHIDILLGEQVQDLAQDLGHVLIGKTDPISRGALQFTVGEIDRIANIAVFNKFNQLARTHNGTVVLCLSRAGS